MTKGPNGEKRPADAIGCAVMVGRIATGEETDTSYVSKNRRNSGVSGAKARMEMLSATKRKQIASLAASARWNKKEATMNVDQDACDTVAAIYADKKESCGLLDVKFLFQNRSEATLTEACAELLAINQAVASGDVTDLDFGDLKWHQ